MATRTPCFHYRLLVYTQWALFALLALLAALFCAWRLLAGVDFLYPVWYELSAIDRTIAAYGPRNRYRQAFETTTKAERMRLFSAIVVAIQRQGEGLETLVYHAPDGRPLGRLLRSPEIIHLQDVARLVDRAQYGGWTVLLALPLVLGLLRRQRLPPPRLRMLLATTAALLAGASAAILAIGPVKVFYALHIWIFPPGHPWFFYYEDSLMTLLMQAPTLFGYITVALLALTLLLWLGLLYLVRRIWLRFGPPPASGV